VTFRYRDSVRSIDIVGNDEADPSAGRLSFSAPMARALIGGGVGDLMDFGGEEEAIEILAVEPIAKETQG
jgi:transcription elongation GreA/GreB family factor